jgi:cell shape-determining protein MreC
MADDQREALASALAELEQLRAENQRLRGLLGLDARLATSSSTCTRESDDG